jgi:DNA-directed RNA polymerase specialized sigma24 family protein
MNGQTEQLAPDFTAGEFPARVTRIATRIAAGYAWNVEPQDVEQEMWMHLLENLATDNTDLLTRPTNEILNKMAWKARDWARRQLCPMRHADGTRWSPTFTAPNETWEWLADTIADEDLDQYAEADERLTVSANWGDAIEATLTTYSGTTAESIIRSLMEGYTKTETAANLGISPATVTWNLKKVRATLQEQKVLSQAGAC